MVLEKAERSVALAKLLVQIATNGVDFKALMAKNGFQGGRTIRVEIVDAGRAFNFRAEKGGLFSWLTTRPDAINVTVRVRCLCILKHIRTGKFVGRHPTTRQYVERPFPPMEAYRLKWIDSEGDGSTGEVLAAASLILDLMEAVPVAEVVDTIGPCEHDLTSNSGESPGTVH